MFHYLQIYPQLLTTPEPQPRGHRAVFGGIVRPHRRRKVATAVKSPAVPPRQPARTSRP